MKNTMELREYQKSLKIKIEQMSQSKKRFLIYSPTGSGKTVVICSVLIDSLKKGLKSLLLVHRDFLIEQTVETFLNLGLKRQDIGVIKAGYEENRSRPIQVASVQTLMRRNIPVVDIVVADECHSIAFWNDYGRITDTNPEAFFMGFTASPWRTRSTFECFGQYFDDVIKGPSIQWLTENNYLASARYFGWGGIVDVSKLETGKDGDYKTRKMEKVYIDANAPSLITKKIKELCPDRTGIIFNSGVQQSLIQAKLLNEVGIHTVHIDGNTDAKTREKTYKDLESGRIQCISSVGCLTEGFDVKSISFVALGRATKSLSLYVQMCGRGLRYHPNKQNCYILDFGGNVTKHGFLAEEREITLEKKINICNNLTYAKECPECGHICWNSLKYCLNCGHEFIFQSNQFTKSKSLSSLEIDDEFGELLDSRTLRYLKILRKERARRFYSNIALFAWECKLKIPTDIKCRCVENQWLVGSIFNNSFSKADIQKFLQHLYDHRMFLSDWLFFDHIQEELSLEFGKEMLNYHPNLFIKKEWWEILNCSPDASCVEIKEIYMQKMEQLINENHPENSEEIELLNFAIDIARRKYDGLQLLSKSAA